MIKRFGILFLVITILAGGLFAYSAVSETRRATITIDRDAWRQILVELGRWGNNLNQCAASLNRIRKAVVAEYQTGLVARETAERVIAAAKECEATLGEAEAVRDDVLAALDRQRASAVIYLQNSRMPTGGEDA